MMLALWVVFLAVVALSGATSIDDCPAKLSRDKYLQAFNGSCFSFHVVDEAHRDYKKARGICGYNGGTLVRVKTPPLQDFLCNHLRYTYGYNGEVLIGLSDIETEGRFMWDDGTPLGQWQNWAPGYGPSGDFFNGLKLKFWRDCVTIDTTQKGKWVENECNSGSFNNNKRPFICQFKAIQTTRIPKILIPSTIKAETEKPTTHKPTTQKPTTQKPITQKLTTQKTTTQKLTTQKPTTQKPTTQKPTTQMPTTQKPTTQKPTPQKPEPTSYDPTDKDIFCYQCGNDDVPCKAIDLLIGSSSKCPPGKPFCMIDVSIQAGQRAVVKRCVDEQTCYAEWYQGSSDRSQCVNFNPLNTRVTDLNCNFCCRGNGCNRGYKPGVDKLYEP